VSRPPVIAIDGPAASGKSSTARAVADRLGMAHLDSGALYRAATLAALDRPVPLQGQPIVGLMRSLPVQLAFVDGAFRPEVAGVDVSGLIRSERVNARVSAVAALPAVREWANAELRAAVAPCPMGVVIDGRDIGTVVFPDAPVKIFLTATPRERAVRRVKQSGGAVVDHEVERVAEDLARRDVADQGRAVAPLAIAGDALEVDSTHLGFEEQVERIVDLARRKLGLAPA